MTITSVYFEKAFEICEKCFQNETINEISERNLLSDIQNCEICRKRLIDDAKPSEVFQLMRKWNIDIQRNMKFFIDLLFAKKCNVNDRDAVTDMTPLMFACKSGAEFIGNHENALKLCKELIDKGADLNVKSNWLNMNCIHLCAFFDSYKCLELVLAENFDAGINAPCESFNCATPLHLALMNKCFKSAHILLSHGANMNQKDKSGRTPLEYLKKEANDAESSDYKLFQEYLKEALVKQNEKLTSKIDNKMNEEAEKLLKSLNIKLNERVGVSSNKTGFLRYCGPTKFANGIWAGVELDKPVGRHDGSLAGVVYFKCPKNHGVFFPFNRIKKLTEKAETNKKTHKNLNNKKLEPINKDILLRRAISSSSTPRTKPVRVMTNKQFESESLNQFQMQFSNNSFKPVNSTSINSLDGDNIEVGMKVLYQGHRAMVRYMGETCFADGIWAGLEFFSKIGKNDGSIQGVRYFTCDKQRGVFVRPNKLTISTHKLK